MEPAGDFAARALTAPTHCEMSKARRPVAPFPATRPRGVYCSGSALLRARDGDGALPRGLAIASTREAEVGGVRVDAPTRLTLGASGPAGGLAWGSVGGMTRPQVSRRWSYAAERGHSRRSGVGVD